MAGGDTNEGIRNLKRPYRKKSYQTGYAQKGHGVNAVPVPYSSYSTETSMATQPQRTGIDPATFKRPVRPSMENLELNANNVDAKVYPWHLVPKANSSNVINRQVVNFTTALPGSGGAFLDAGQFVDMLVININDGDVIGTQTWANNAPDASVLPQSTIPTFPPQASVGVGGQPFTQASTGISTGGPSPGGAFTGVTTAGTATATEVGRNNELYLISSFGHTQPTAAGAAQARYQIWVDGSLLFDWQNFQWSVVVPESDQWHFKVPLVVERQIVFRVINTGAAAGVDILTGPVQAAFVGWSEQQTGFTDVGRQALEGGV
jgi:hypothetical protein